MCVSALNCLDFYRLGYKKPKYGFESFCELGIGPAAVPAILARIEAKNTFFANSVIFQELLEEEEPGEVLAPRDAMLVSLAWAELSYAYKS